MPSNHVRLTASVYGLAMAAVAGAGILRWLSRHKDGRWRQVKNRAVLLRGKDGQPLKIIGCTLDVTAQKEATTELKSRETPASGVLSSITDGFFSLDQDWRITHINSLGERALNRMPGELIGKLLWDEFPGTVDSEFERVYRSVVAGQVAESFTAYYPDFGRWYELTAHPAAQGLSVYFRDITDRKRVEAELRQSEARFRAGIEAVSDIVWTNDAKGMMAGEQLGWGNFTGQNRENYAGYGWARAVHPEDAQPTLDAWHEAVAAKKPFSFEHRIRRHDGQWRLCSVRAVALMDDQGEITEWVGVHTDITERKEAEARLRASEARLRQVFESNVVGMIRWDLSRSLILDANAEFLRMTGYARSDVVSGDVNFRELTPSEWTAQNEKGIHAIQADGHAQPYEKEYFRKDGSRLPLIIAGTRFEDSPSEGMSFLVDISDMKRAEAALRHSNERHSYLVKLAQALRPLSNPTEVQAEACRILGEQLGANRVAYFEVEGGNYVVEQDHTVAVTALRGSFPVHSFGPEMLADFRAGRTAVQSDVTCEPLRPQAERDAFAAARIRSYVGVPLLKDGEFVAGLSVNSANPRTWTPTEIVMIEDTAQWTWGAVVRARSAAALQKSESRFTVAIKNTRIIVYTTDADLRYTWVHNPHPTFNAADILGRRDDELLSPEQAAPLIAIKLDVLTSGVGARDEFTVEINGERVVYDLTVEPLRDARGSVVGVTVAAMDITERKKTEDDLRRLGAELADTGRHKDEFLATLAHELRNPLAPIRNCLQVMRMAGANPDVVEKNLGMMERQVGQLIHLIDDLMDLSRISAGKIVLQKARLRLADVIQDAVDTSRPLMDLRQHALVVDIPSELVCIDADRTRLVQMFGNLLNNAAKYTEPGGRIRVAVERHGGNVMVAVEDNGVGIAADLLTRVFDMFAQVDGSLEKSQGGLGIGLSIARRLAEMHGGSIIAESGGNGSGSRFVVRLPVPLNGTIDTPEDPRHALKTNPARRRILVVDDNRDGASSLAEMLDMMGSETKTAFDGEEAVNVAEAFKPDIVLMDIGMPKLNGYDACRHIRAQPWGRNIVIVAQTGWGQDEDRRKAQEAGFDFHMVKPIDCAALEKILAESKTSIA